MADLVERLRGFSCFNCGHEAAVHEEAADEIEKLRAALTPSADTKAAYMGEFSIDLPDWDEDGNEVVRRVNVPWTTVKEIMAAILTHAAPSVRDTGGGDET